MNRPITLTPADVQFFHDNGYLAVRNVIPPEVVAQVRAGAARLQAEYACYRKEKNIYYTSTEAKNFAEMMDGSAAARSAAVLWRIDDLADKMPEVALLKQLPFVHNAMRSLLGDELLQYNESFVTKPPRIGQPVHWHQDPSFKVRKTTDPISTIDIYLDKADEENGCIWIVPGSHKRGVLDVEALTAQHGWDMPGAIAVRMEPGDVAFHDNGCLHGSRENRSDRERRIVYLAFQTLRQARASGKFTEELIQQRVKAFNQYRL